MAFAFVKQTTLQNVAATSQSFSVTSTAGHLLVACFATNGTAFALSSVADSAGNTWTSQAGVNGTNAPEVSLWSCPNAAAITSLTATLASSQTCSLSLLEFSGQPNGTGNDGVNGNGFGTATTAFNPGGVTTTAAGDLVVGVVGWTATTTVTASSVSSGFTLAANLTGSSTKLGFATAYQVAGAAGSYDPAFTLSASTTGNGGVVAWKLATAPFPPFPPHVSPVYRM